MFDSLTAILGEHHVRCDRVLAAIEAAIARSAWDEAQRDATQLRHALEWHMDVEESILFPAFEAATGGGHGPTSVMRDEHRRLRELLETCTTALAAKDATTAVEAIGSMQALLQQHNAKEENILYPACEAVLGERAASIVARIRSEIADYSPQ